MTTLSWKTQRGFRDWSEMQITRETVLYCAFTFVYTCLTWSPMEMLWHCSTKHNGRHTVTTSLQSLCLLSGAIVSVVGSSHHSRPTQSWNSKKHWVLGKMGSLALNSFHFYCYYPVQHGVGLVVSMVGLKFHQSRDIFCSESKKGDLSKVLRLVAYILRLLSVYLSIHLSVYVYLYYSGVLC